MTDKTSKQQTDKQKDKQNVRMTEGQNNIEVRITATEDRHYTMTEGQICAANVGQTNLLMTLKKTSPILKWK